MEKTLKPRIIKSLEESKRGIGINRYSSVEEMMKELYAEIDAESDKDEK